MEANKGSWLLLKMEHQHHLKQIIFKSMLAIKRQNKQHFAIAQMS
jgi:hypothetical protein